MATPIFGSTLSGATTSTIGYITDWNLSDISRDTIEASSCDSTNQIKNFIAGMVDPGKLTFSALYDKADFDSMHDAMSVSTIEAFTLTLADGSTYVVDGLLDSLSMGGSLGDIVKVDGSIKCCDIGEFTPAA